MYFFIRNIIRTHQANDRTCRITGNGNCHAHERRLTRDVELPADPGQCKSLLEEKPIAELRPSLPPMRPGLGALADIISSVPGDLQRQQQMGVDVAAWPVDLELRQWARSRDRGQLPTRGPPGSGRWSKNLSRCLKSVASKAVSCLLLQRHSV